MSNVFSQKNVLFITVLLILYRFFINAVFLVVLTLFVFALAGNFNFSDSFFSFLIILLLINFFASMYLSIFVVLSSYSTFLWKKNEIFVKNYLSKEKIIMIKSIDLIIVSRSLFGSYFLDDEVYIVSLRLRGENSFLKSIYSLGFRTSKETKELLEKIGDQTPVSNHRNPLY